MWRWIAKTALLLSVSASLAAAAPRASTTCDAKCLESMLDGYVAALANRDASAVPVRHSVRYTENGQVMPFGTGIWSDVSRIGSYRIVASDPVTGNAIYMGVLEERGKLNSFAVRIHASDHTIDQVEVTVGRDAHTSQGDSYLAKTSAARPGFTAPPPHTAIFGRQELIAKVREYYTVAGTAGGVNIDFDPACHRIENGVAFTNNPASSLSYKATNGKELPNFTAMSCADQFKSGIWSGDNVSAMRFAVVDQRRGTVVVLGFYNAFGKKSCATTRSYGTVCPDPPTPPVSLRFNEAFHIVGGRIREVESVWALAKYPPTASW